MLSESGVVEADVSAPGKSLLSHQPNGDAGLPGSLSRLGRFRQPLFQARAYGVS